MQRFVLGLLCALAYACSTPLYVDGFEGEDEPSIEGDAQLGDAQIRDAQVGDARVPDGGRLDASLFPGVDASVRDGAVFDASGSSELFDFECEVYDVPAVCPRQEPTPNTACSPMMTRGATCPALTDDGWVIWLQCATRGGASTWIQPTPQRNRCGHDCDALPANSFFNLDDSDCMLRSVLSCDTGFGRTSQENIDTLLNVALRGCSLPTANTYSITFNAQGCPNLFLTDHPRLSAEQQRCVAQILERSRLSCSLAPPTCATTRLGLPVQ